MAIAALLGFVSHCGSLRTLELPIQDSHYDLGLKQGIHFRSSIAAYLNSSNDLQQVLLPYCADANNATHCHSLRRNAERTFPSYAAELRGLAAGAQVPEAWLWALNMADEIHSLRGGFPHTTRTFATGSGGGACTALLNSSSVGTRFIAHNEDGGHCIAPPQDVYLLRSGGVRAGNVDKVNNHDHKNMHIAAGTAAFTAFVYPGSLPGYAFGATSHGLGLTVNSEFVEAQSVDATAGVPNIFLTRDLLESLSAQDATRRAQQYRAASGFTANVGDTGARSLLYNIEVGPRQQTSVLAIEGKDDSHYHQGGSMTIGSSRGGDSASSSGTSLPNRTSADGFLAHFNQYQRLAVAEYPDPSSDARAATVQRLVQANRGALYILGDQSNPSHLEIWRNFSLPRIDACKTVASAVLDFISHSMCIHTRNPRIFPQADACYPIGDKI